MASMLQMLTTPVSGGELARLAQETRAASMQPYQPGMRERLGSALYDLFGRNATANRIRNEGMMLADFIPGVGDAIGAQEAASDYQAGNYLGAGLGGVATAMGVIPGAGDALGRAVKSAEEPIRQGIRAFHGSPHDFDRFSMDHIGTGEGAQAYGHGLYFAESEDVARGYRDQLSAQAGLGGRGRVVSFRAGGSELPAAQKPEADIAFTMQQHGIDPSTRDGADWLAYEVSARNATAPRDINKDLVVTLYRGAPIEQSRQTGRMYEVSINANPEDFLDWDAPLSEQPERVRQALNAILDTSGDAADKRAAIFADFDSGLIDRATRNERLAALQPGASGQTSGSAIYNRIAGTGQANIDRLREAGIPGIRYLDAGSRGAGDGTRNYVVFDDSLISIVRKYGIAAAIAGGIITREQAEQMQAQGVI